MNPRQQRQARMYQAKSRGDLCSHKTKAENLGLLLLWEAEVLSEGQAARALDIDRVTLRLMREQAIAEAMWRFKDLVPEPKT